MKICTVCSAENESERVRCAVCNSILPLTEVLDSPIAAAEESGGIICSSCGKENDRSAVRCEGCGRVLATSKSGVKRLQRRRNLKPLRMKLASGEVVTLLHGQVIGREYQPKVFDAYAPRSAYTVVFKSGKYYIRDNKTAAEIPVEEGREYVIGRTKVVFGE